MKHLTLPRFWRHYRQLPKEVQDLADKSFELLKADPYHPSLHFKKVGRTKQLWLVHITERWAWRNQGALCGSGLAPMLNTRSCCRDQAVAAQPPLQPTLLPWHFAKRLTRPDGADASRWPSCE